MIITLIGDYLFILSKGKSTFFYYYYYHVCLPWFIQSNSTCHGHMNEVPSKRGIVYAQARPKWVAVWLVLTPLLRTLRPSTAGGSPAQHYKNAHHRPQKGGKWYLHPILWDIICVKFHICFFKKNKVDRLHLKSWFYWEIDILLYVFENETREHLSNKRFGSTCVPIF